MKTLYFDLFSGCSGDMLLGALIDLGIIDLNEIEKGLSLLDIGGYLITRKNVLKNGISAVKIDVLMDRETDSRQTHCHDNHNYKSLHHRTFKDIKALISSSNLDLPTKEMSLKIFDNLAKAEAMIHGVTPDEVHFHEVGAVDSIVDIVGIAIALNQIGATHYYCSPANVGGGTLKCAHGILPVPAPATAELLRGFPVYSTTSEGELLTPTCAAVLKTLVSKPGTLPEGKLIASGYGAGNMDFRDIPNVLRVILLESESEDLEKDKIAALSCNVDDISGELVGNVAQRCLEKGALDVFLTPIQMKKFRPGTMITVLCTPGLVEHIGDILMEETSTFGIRIQYIERKILSRKMISLKTSFGMIDIKLGIKDGHIIKIAPEYESCRNAAISKNVPLSRVFQEAQANANSLVGKSLADILQEEKNRQ